jgi:DNA-binding MarR family transcriptional regulator
MSKPFYKLESYQSRRSIGYLLRRAGKLITARIESLFVKEDVSFVQWVILMNLRDGLRLTAAELSQHLCHDSGALTRVIDQMEERGLISRERSTADRRMVTLQLTAEGNKVIATFLPRIIDLYNGLLTDFTPEETEAFISMLTRLTDKIAETPGN